MSTAEWAITRPRPWVEVEKQAARWKGIALVAALERNGWGLTATARELVVGVSRLQKLIVQFGLAKIYAQHARPPGRRKATAPAATRQRDD